MAYGLDINTNTGFDFNWGNIDLEDVPIPVPDITGPPETGKSETEDTWDKIKGGFDFITDIYEFGKELGDDLGLWDTDDKTVDQRTNEDTQQNKSFADSLGDWFQKTFGDRISTQATKDMLPFIIGGFLLLGVVIFATTRR